MSEQRKEINYVVALIAEFSRHFGLPAKEGFLYLYTHKAIEFIKENYEIEHQLSFAEAVQDCAMICRKNGGDL